LKHVERTAVLLHLIDAYTEKPAEAYKTIRSELERYSPELVGRREVVALTKIEGLDADIVQHQLAELQSVVSAQTPLFAISSPAHTGVTDLLRELVSQVKDARAEAVPEIIEDPDATPVIRLTGKQEDDAWHVVHEEGNYTVTGTKIEKFAARTDYDNPHSVNRLRDIMRKLGVTHELERQGAKPDDVVVIGEVGEYRLSLQEQ
jgi:GTP-binding protein